MAGTGAGYNLVLRVEDDSTPGTFNDIGGLQTKSLSFQAEGIEKTNHGSNQWKELVEAAGLRSMSWSGSGVFTDSSGESQCQAAALAQTLKKFRLIDVGSADYFEGYFKITGFEYAGEHNGVRTWSISLESSGEIAFTAA